MSWVRRTLYPVKPRQLVKWERMRGWVDAQGDAWVGYSIRLTEKEIPKQYRIHEQLTDLAMDKCFYIAEDGTNDTAWSTRFVTYAATARLEDLHDLFEAVRNGLLHEVTEGMMAVRL